MKIKTLWWNRIQKNRIVIRKCKGCGWKSDVPIGASFLACCPDDNYKIISIKPLNYDNKL